MMVLLCEQKDCSSVHYREEEGQEGHQQRISQVLLREPRVASELFITKRTVLDARDSTSMQAHTHAHAHTE